MKYKLKRDGTLGWEWSDVGDWFSTTATATADQLQQQLPGQLVNQINQELFPQPTQQQTTVVKQPVYATSPSSYINSAAQSMGVPPAVIYGAMAIGGLAAIAILIKALK